MPTPTDASPSASYPLHRSDLLQRWPTNAICPPGELWQTSTLVSETVGLDGQPLAAENVLEQPETPDSSHSAPGNAQQTDVVLGASSQQAEFCDGLSPVAMLSPTSSTTSEVKEDEVQLTVPARRAAAPAGLGLSAPESEARTRYEISNIRVRGDVSRTRKQVTGLIISDPQLLPNCSSSFLRPGSRFRGTQKSERRKNDVQVEIKHVDMDQSFLCGYLRIEGNGAAASFCCLRTIGRVADFSSWPRRLD